MYVSEKTLLLYLIYFIKFNQVYNEDDSIYVSIDVNEVKLKLTVSDSFPSSSDFSFTSLFPFMFYFVTSLHIHL